MAVDSDVPWDLVAQIRRSERKKQIILELEGSPASASDLAEDLNIQRESISNYFNELKNLDPPVVACITPDQPHHRLYALTETGEIVAEHVER